MESRAELGNGRGTWDPWFTRTIVSADDAVRPGTYFSDRTMDVYVVLFVALQCLLLYWLSLILKIVARVVRGGTANDVREDDD